MEQSCVAPSQQSADDHHWQQQHHLHPLVPLESHGEWPVYWVLGNIDSDYLSSVQSSNYNQFMIMQINPDYNEHYQWLVLHCKGWDDLKASSAEICVVCVLMTDGVCCFVVLTQSDRFIRMQCSRARTPPSSSGNITEKWNIFHNFQIILTRLGLSHWGWCHYQLHDEIFLCWERKPGYRGRCSCVYQQSSFSWPWRAFHAGTAVSPNLPSCHHHH